MNENFIYSHQEDSTFPLAFGIVVVLFGTLYGALAGDYGAAWQAVSWIGTVVVALVALLAGFVFLDEKFGWGLTDSDSAAGSEAEPSERQSADGERPRLGRRIPHPDDPAPSEEAKSPADTTASLPPPPEVPPQELSSPPEVEPNSNVYNQIRRLAELRDEGLVSSEEFEAKKQELLDRL